MFSPLASSQVTAPGASPSQWMVVMHGILGRRANWRGIARRVVADRPDWGLLLVDLRHHGDSGPGSGPDTVAGAAADVAASLDAAGIEAHAALGHSFGGKVALALLERLPTQLRHTFVIDAMPGPWAPDHASDTPRVLAALEGLPRRYASRRTFETRFEAEGFGRGVAQWLAMNLERVEDPEGSHFELGLDLAAIRRLLDDYVAWDAWPVVEPPEGPPGQGAVHLVVGGRSSAYDAAALARAEAAAAASARVTLRVLPQAGHWVHADDPEGLLTLLLERL